MFYEGIDSLIDKPDKATINNFARLTEWLERRQKEIEQQRFQTDIDKKLGTQHTETIKFGYKEDDGLGASIVPSEGEVRYIP